MSQVVSEGCERVLNLISLTIANSRSQEAAILRSVHQRGRLRRQSNQDRIYGTQTRVQSTMFRVMSLVEAHTADEIITRLVTELPPPRSVIQQSAYSAGEDAAARSWSDMKVRLTRWFAMDISTCASWPDLMTLVEVRHAVAHGTGELTRKQIRDQDMARWRQRLRQVDISLDGKCVVLTPDSVATTLQTAKSYLA